MQLHHSKHHQTNLNNLNVALEKLDEAKAKNDTKTEIDLWEHAYYLQYKNVRPDNVNSIWKVANWKYIEQRYLAGRPKKQIRLSKGLMQNVSFDHRYKRR